MSEIFKNIITFGAHNRIENEKLDYENIIEKLEALDREQENKKNDVNVKMEDIVRIKKESIHSLNKIRKITKNLKLKDRQLIELKLGSPKEEINIEKIENSIELGLTAINTSKGVGAGIATASSAYFLVGNFAAASTGTAISGLSGAAATNATLAWLGGGSLATGGGGIAAGTAVMGGLVAIPALAVMGIYQHFSANKKIKEIKGKKLEAIKLIDNISSNLLALQAIEKRTQELKRGILKSKDVFDIEFKNIYKKIYPIPILTKLYKQIKKILGFDYFSKNDLGQIAYIGKIATDFAKIIDTKIIEK